MHAGIEFVACICVQPVVEYVGAVIRNVVSDKRETLYELQRGGDGSCYMFRLDAAFVVDATRKGNMSRFINHSCAVRRTHAHRERVKEIADRDTCSAEAGIDTRKSETEIKWRRRGGRWHGGAPDESKTH